MTNIEWEIKPIGVEPSSSINIRSLIEESEYISLIKMNDQEKKIIDELIQISFKKDILELINLVDSTYPVFLQLPIGTKLDLVKIADRYREVQETAAWNAKTTSDQDWHSVNAIDK